MKKVPQKQKDKAKRFCEVINPILHEYETLVEEMFKARRKYVEAYMSYYDIIVALPNDVTKCIIDAICDEYEKKFKEYDQNFFLDSRMIELKLEENG